mgnify:CR=1 FL=1
MKLFLSVLILSFSLLSLVPHVWAQDPHAAIAASLTRIEAALKAGPTTAAVSSDPVDDVIRLEYSMMKLDRLQAIGEEVVAKASRRAQLFMDWGEVLDLIADLWEARRDAYRYWAMLDRERARLAATPGSDPVF